jgi:hypothetical protein
MRNNATTDVHAAVQFREIALLSLGYICLINDKYFSMNLLHSSVVSSAVYI